MTGYCTELGRNVEMNDIETLQLPDLSFIHRGKYTEAGKSYTIWRKVQDENIIVTLQGHKYPNIVHAGPNTPRKLYRDVIGQQVVSRIKGVPNIKMDKNIKKQTLEELKRKVADAKKIPVIDLRD